MVCLGGRVDLLGRDVETLLGTVSRVADTTAWVSGAVALAVVLLPTPWRLTRTVVTIVHEAGHALAGLLVGRRLRGIRLHSDTSGVTVSRGRPSGPGMVFTTVAGYPAPALLGLAFAGVITTGLPSAVLVVAAVLLVAVLLLIRNLYGAFAVVASAVVLAGVAVLAPPGVRIGFVYALTWFLLLAAVRPVFELAGKRMRRRARDSDVDQLARLTGIPAALWLLLLGAFAVLCLATGGVLLVEPLL